VKTCEALAFRCTGCGNCCRTLRVALTHLDVARLMRGTGKPAEAFVEWLAPDQVDMTGEPGSLVELAEGRRLMVLAHSTHGSCSFLDADNRCSVHPHRPADCRLFPFDPRVTARGTLRLRLLPLDGCDHALDGDNDPEALVTSDRARWEALALYQERVARFNRAMRTRKRLHKRLGTAREFLAFIGVGGD
jgi:Fe-S-cluster containining protein